MTHGEKPGVRVHVRVPSDLNQKESPSRFVFCGIQVRKNRTAPHCAAKEDIANGRELRGHLARSASEVFRWFRHGFRGPYDSPLLTSLFQSSS